MDVDIPLKMVQQARVIKVIALSIGAASTLWAAVGALASTTHQSVAGHRFEVPKEYLFDARMAWLPAPESDSFTFLLEPNAEPDRIPDHRFLVQSLAGRCNGGGSEMMRVACGEEQKLMTATPQYERKPNEFGSWSSDLFIVARDNGDQAVRRQQVAYCQLFEPNPAMPKPKNLCTAAWSYKGMLLQFSFNEAEVSRLQEMKELAMASLDRWEVR